MTDEYSLRFLVAECNTKCVLGPSLLELCEKGLGLCVGVQPFLSEYFRLREKESVDGLVRFTLLSNTRAW